ARDFPLCRDKHDVLILDAPGTVGKMKQLKNFKAGVLVINYEAAWRKPIDVAIKKIDWDIVLYDESQRIKGPGSKASVYCAALRTRIPHRYELTGTALPHSPLDIYAQFRAIDIGPFGKNYSDFKYEFEEMEMLELHKPIIGKHGRNKGKMINRVSVHKNFKNLKEFARRMGTITYHCNLSDVDKEIPPLSHEEICFNLPPKVMKIYNEMKTELVTWVKSGVQITAANILVKSLRLQQIIGGHSKDDNGKVVNFDDTKENLLYDFLQDIPIQEPVCVYCWFTQDLRAIERVAKKLGRMYGEISGQRKDLTKDACMPDWVCLMGVQIRSGGVAIDLSRAEHYGVMYSTGHSRGDFDQACARQRNPYKKNKVTMYHMIARNTVARTTYTALKKKKDLADAIIGYLHEEK
ncbi:hypothetical protein IIC38_00545, partial [candidate division KSB1 bacterium]|nr:hypothetical protein [candidate division KSB1 bacterium]